MDWIIMNQTNKQTTDHLLNYTPFINTAPQTACTKHKVISFQTVFRGCLKLEMKSELREKGSNKSLKE